MHFNYINFTQLKIAGIKVKVSDTLIIINKHPTFEELDKIKNYLNKEGYFDGELSKSKQTVYFT